MVWFSFAEGLAGLMIGLVVVIQDGFVRAMIVRTQQH
jgi:hypothetical protein